MANVLDKYITGTSASSASAVNVLDKYSAQTPTATTYPRATGESVLDKFFGGGETAQTTPASTAKVGANLAGSLAADGSGTGTNNSILGILSPKYTKLAASGKEEASAAASKEAAAKNALAVALPQMPLKMQSAMKQETEYDPVTGFDMPTQDAARVDAKRLGAGTEYAVRTGLDEAASGISSTLDLLIGKNITLLGNLIGQDWSQNPISAINERLQAEKTANQQILSEQMQRAGVSKTGETVANLGTMVTAAVPQAVMALLSAGTSLAGEGTTAALQAASSVGMATAGTKLVELGRTMSTALTAMAKSPNYWTAFLQVAGNNYDDEKAKGASDFRAVAFAVVNGLLNAMVEVGGGGIQELPTQLKSGSSSAVMAWVESMFDEGKEEVVQGVIERLLQNVIVGENNALFSTTDANAVINPVTAAKEFGGGALVGGILGGGQSLITGGGTNVPGSTVQNAETTRTAQTAQTQEQTAPVTQQSTQAAQTAQEQSDVEAQRDAQAAAEAQEEIDSGALKKAEATVTEIVTKPVTNSKAKQIIDDPALSAAFERLSGETLTGTISEQRSIIKDYAAALEAQREIEAGRENGEARDGFPASYDGEGSQTERTVSATESVGAAAKGFATTPYTQWQEDTPDNGFHDMGEKARRNVGLPKVNPQGENTMKTAQTVMEAANTPDARAEQLAQYMVDGKAAYVPVSNESLATKAENTIEYKGWQTALTDWTADVRRGKANAELVAVGAQLINSAGNSNASASEYLNLFADYANLLNATGKSLQAARILKTLTPEGKLYGIKRSVDSIKAEVRGAEDIEIPAELVKEYKEATTDEARDKVIDKITQSVADQIPSTAIDKWTALRYVNMLGNFKTQVRNVVGNVGMGLISKAKRTIEAALQQVFTPREQRTRAIGYSKGLLKAAWNDFLLVKNEALGEGKYHEGYNGTQFARAVNDQRAIFKNSGAWGTKTDSSAFAKAARQITNVLWKVPEAYRVAANWAMEQGDIIFNRAAYADTLAGYLRAKGYTAQQFNDGAIPESVLEAARSDAIRESQEATFRDTNAVSRFASRVLRGEDTPKMVKAVAEGIAPFRKTPANILVRAEEYSMLGAVNTAVKAIQKSSGSSEVSGVDVINSLSKTLTGTGLTFLGMALYNAGWLRGKDDDDNQEAFDLLRGKQDYSITLPTGESFTVDWLSPASMPVFMGATLAQATFENGLSISDVEEVLTSIADPMIEMSMLQGLNNALDNIKYSDNNLIQLVISSAVSYLSQGLTNTLLGQVERTFGENTRQSNYSVKDSALPSWLQYSIAKASAKTPGWDYNQVEYIDAWGRTQSTGALGERALSNFLSPSYISNDRSAEVDDELQRVYDALDGEENVFPTRVTMSDTIKGEALTEDTYKVYATTRGQTALKELGKLFKSSEYKSMSDAEKANAIQDVYSAANETAKQVAVESAGGMYFTDKDHEARYEEYKSAGLSPSRAYDLYKTLDGLTFPDGATNAEKQQTTVQTIYSGGYTEKQTAALVGLLYTNSAKTSLLSDLNVSDRLISLYLTSGNTDMINMTVPSTVSENSVSYELTDAEKATFRQLYTDYFNQRATYISTEQQLNKLRDEAWAEAKAAVIAARG